MVIVIEERLRGKRTGFVTGKALQKTRKKSLEKKRHTSKDVWVRKELKKQNV